jgi:hypothetical protein
LLPNCGCSKDFPPKIEATTLRTCTKEYYQILEKESKQSPCALCGSLLQDVRLRRVGIDEDYISPYLPTFDHCGIDDDYIFLCPECDSSIRKRIAPKFSAANYVNTSFCDTYPVELKGLTYIEECVLALAHPIGALIKLTGGGRSLGVKYRGSRGHFITFKQDPS